MIKTITQTETRLFFIKNNFRYALSKLSSYGDKEIDKYIAGIDAKELKGFNFAGHINDDEYIASLSIKVDWDRYGNMIEHGEIMLDRDDFRDGEISHEVFAMVTEFKNFCKNKNLNIKTTFYIVPTETSNRKEYYRVCDKYNLSYGYSKAKLVGESNEYITELLGLKEMTMNFVLGK